MSRDSEYTSFFYVVSYLGVVFTVVHIANICQWADPFAETVNTCCRYEDTFTTYEIQTWLPDIILGMDRFRNLTAWPVWVEVTGYIGNKTKISSLSIDRQLKFQLTAWQKWEIKLYKMGISPQSTQAVISLQWRCLPDTYTKIYKSSNWS